jgi:hypothetical protein
MSLIMRGMGSDPKLITAGFGPQSILAKTAIPDVAGRSSRRAYKEIVPKESKNTVDTYIIIASLETVNGKRVPISENRMIGYVLANDNIEVKILRPPSIVKTKPRRNILIKVHKVFKR